MRGKGGKRLYWIKIKGQIILPNMDPILPYPLRLFKSIYHPKRL